ncbi:MAG: hypothetical protein H0W84_02765 [Bacteroidetes bacterium]|nr:hypothetical protein [Bacteroidota bacterium]
MTNATYQIKRILGATFLSCALLLSNGCKKDPSDIKSNPGKSGDDHENPPVTDTLPCGSFRTQTQGGWGSEPHGNNPGTYLHANFAAAFPNGLTVGCTNTLTFTSAQAITNYLPDGGTGVALTQSYTDPVGLKNVLAAQIVTLSISVQMDIFYPNFSGSSIALQDLIIGSGPFAGLTLKAMLVEANKVLGGCTSTYTVSQIISVVSSINENFDDGTKNNGFLKCPTGGPSGGNW